MLIALVSEYKKNKLNKGYDCHRLCQKFEILTISTQGKNFSREQFEIFSKKIGFDSSCKLSPLETICMKCQNLFSGKNKKNIINLSSAELAERMAKFKCEYTIDGS